MVLLQAEGGEGFLNMNLIMILLIGVVFYFFMIRPQTKRMKEHKKLIQELQKGDKVVTNGGIIGRIVEIQPDQLLIEIAPNVRVRFQKTAISLEASKTLKQEQEKKEEAK